MKRIVSVLLIAVMALSFTACGAKRQSAQDVVDQAITAVKDMDWETAQAYWGEDALDAASNLTETETDEQALALLQLLTQSLSYTITGSQEDEQAGTATVSVDFTNVNMSLVLAELIKNALSDALTYAFLPEDQQPSDEEMTAKYLEDLTELMTADDVEMLTTSVDIPLTLEDDQWKIASSEEAADAMLGGIISYAESMAEQFSGLTE